MACTLLLLFLISSPAQRISVEGVVVDETGGVLPGVEVTATASTGQSWMTNTGDSGEFVLELPAGVYSVVASLTGFKDGRIERLVPDEPKMERLQITLAVGAISQECPLVIGPRPIPAPNLELKFAFDSTRESAIAGTVVLTNTGDTTILIPQTRPYNSEVGTLNMNLTGYSKEPWGVYNGWFACWPGVDCQILESGQSARFPMVLRTDFSEGAVAQTFMSPGPHAFIVSVSFIPADDPNARTEAITQTFNIEVPN